MDPLPMKTPRDDHDEELLTKDELASRLKLTPRGVDCLVSDGRISAFRISRKCVRFSWVRVLKDLGRFEN